MPEGSLVSDFDHFTSEDSDAEDFFNDENRPMTRSHLQNQAVNVNDEDAAQSSGQALDVPQQEVHGQAHQEIQHLQDDQRRLRPRKPMNYEDFHRFGKR